MIPLFLSKNPFRTLNPTVDTIQFDINELKDSY